MQEPALPIPTLTAAVAALAVYFMTLLLRKVFVLQLLIQTPNGILLLQQQIRQVASKQGSLIH